MFPLRPMDRLKFFVERQFVKGAHYQLLVMALVLVLISLIAGTVVLGTDPDESYGEAVWWAFLRLSDPGYLGDDEGFRRRVVSTILTMSGYVLVLGTVVAILTRWLINFMRELERGLTPVAMEDHFVIVGWTNRTVPIIAELLARTHRRGRLARLWRKKTQLAVLAEDVSSELSHELRLAPTLRGRRSDVVLRSGSALNSEALQRVASLDAAAIILPTQIFDSEEAITSDVQTVKALLSIDGLTAHVGADLPLVVAEIQDMRKIPVARRAYRGPLEVIAGDRVISRLIAHSLREPGLTQVYHELLTSFSAKALHIRPGLEMNGLTIEDAQNRLEDEILLGVVRPEKDGFVPHLAPRLDFPIDGEDRLVLLGDGELALGHAKRPAPPPKARGENNILVLGWSEKLLPLLYELRHCGSEDGQITVVSTVPVEERQRYIVDYGLDLDGQLCRHVKADFTIRHQLRAVNPGQYGKIIFISSDRLDSGGEADARTIVGYLSLQEILDEVEATPPQILIELAEARNKQLFGNRPGEVIVSSLLLSNVLAQIAAHPEFNCVLDELFATNGARIDFRPADSFGLEGGDYTFRHLSEQIRAQDGILLGISGQLNPPAHQSLTIDPSDLLIVMSVS